MARTTRWLRLWLYGLNGGLLLFAAGLSLTTGGRIAVFLMVLVPLTFVPFSYTRVRLHRLVVARLDALGRGSSIAIGLTLAGMLLDAVMTAQLLTSRSATNVSFLQSAGVAWIGPVWFSAHALLFLGYAVLAGGRSVVRLIGWLSAKIKPRTAPEVIAGGLVLGRRDFLGQLGLVGAGAPFIVSLGSIQLSYDFRVEQRELTLPHWPKELDGLRIAHLSDIHVGGAMNRERLLHVPDIFDVFAVDRLDGFPD